MSTSTAHVRQALGDVKGRVAQQTNEHPKRAWGATLVALLPVIIAVVKAIRSRRKR